MTRSSVTPAQKAHLLKLWAEEGTAAAYAVAPSYGVTRGYVQKMCHYNGVKAKPKPKAVKPIKNAADPQFARGLVVVGGYWQSTKAPVHLFPREYESPELAKYLSENAFIDAAQLAGDVNISRPVVEAYQRRLGVRKITNKRDAA
jgi:hypothetical protein